jgi:S-formylglutathione hydrolase FrmB
MTTNDNTIYNGLYQKKYQSYVNVFDIRFSAWFKSKGLNVEFASFPGDHEWQVWRKSLHDFAQKLFK